MLDLVSALGRLLQEYARMDEAIEMFEVATLIKDMSVPIHPVCAPPGACK